MKQTQAAVAAALFLFVCTARVTVAEENVPATAPTGSESQSVAVVEQPALPMNPDPDAANGGGAAVEAPQPDPEAWRPVVDNLRPSYWDASPLPVQGVAMYYNPGVFQRVLDFRYKNDHVTECDECIGYVALLRAGDIDRRVWLQRAGRRPEGPFWVVDVAARKDIPALLSRNWAADIDYRTAMRWRMAGPIPITVYAADSPQAREAAAAYFSSEMIPLPDRHIIPPAAYSYRAPETTGKPAAPSADPSRSRTQPANAITMKDGGSSPGISTVANDAPYQSNWIN